MAVLRGEKPDSPPWFVDLIYWYETEKIRGTLPEKYMGLEGYRRLCEDLGCGTYGGLISFPGTVNYSGGVTVRYFEDKTDGGRLKRTVYETPVGELSSIESFSEVSYSWRTVKYPVESEKDFKVYRYILRNLDVKPDYTLQEKQIKVMGGWGAVSSLPPRIPFARLLIELCGVANTYKAMLKMRGEVEETLQLMEDLDDRFYEIILDSPTPLVCFGDNISSELVSPPIFRKYYAPYYKRRFSQLHSRGMYGYIHIDGALRGVLPLVDETGADCVESVTPAPVGDAPIEGLRKLAGQRIALWGGVPGAYLSVVYPFETLKSLVHRIVELLPELGRFILGSADQLPPNGDPERVKWISEEVEKIGRR
jgi:hypothetical protein